MKSRNLIIIIWIVLLSIACLAVCFSQDMAQFNNGVPANTTIKNNTSNNSSVNNNYPTNDSQNFDNNVQYNNFESKKTETLTVFDNEIFLIENFSNNTIIIPVDSVNDIITSIDFENEGEIVFIEI